MNNKAAAKFKKRRERDLLRARARFKSSVGPNRWSTAVHLWVDEFQKRDHNESLPAFDSLFKDVLAAPGPADGTPV